LLRDRQEWQEEEAVAMAIKVPSEMVYYSERDAQSERLLCWIPPQQYPEVTAGDAQALQRLQQNYPTGLEVRVDARELSAEAIQLPVPPQKLVETYRALKAKGALNESGLIVAQALHEAAQAREGGETLDAVIEVDRRRRLVRPADTLPGPAERAFRSIADEPEMKGDEDPRAVYRRLSVRKTAGRR
jgi:hypothetical protein